MIDFYRKDEEIQKDRLHDIFSDLTYLMKSTSLLFKVWVGLLLILILSAGYFYYTQFVTGLGVTGLRDIVSWGTYIATFVFLIAVSLVGSLISAILKLIKIKWVTPLTRIAEIIAVGSLIGALTIIVFDMGRPERLWHIMVYGRLQSPIVWDILVVNTYLVISLLLLYIPLIPDFALMSKKFGQKEYLKKLFRILAIGWQGTEKQFKIMNRSIYALMVLIVPVAFSIHTVTSWLFASTLRPGWDSTIFGPYFISGAFMVGAAAVVVVMYFVRLNVKLKSYISNDHFNLMGQLLVLTSMVYLYFNLNEFLVPAYKMKIAEGVHLKSLLESEYALLFWLVQIVGMILPIILLVFKKFRKPVSLTVISGLVIAGAFLKRYIIVVPTLLHPYLPVQNYPEYYHHYTLTTAEIMITLGCLAGVSLIITMLIKLLPVIPIVETAHEKGIHNETINNA
jgi:molybdopterin-containing oxidoreductase family membrane subunit